MKLFLTSKNKIVISVVFTLLFLFAINFVQIVRADDSSVSGTMPPVGSSASGNTQSNNTIVPLKNPLKVNSISGLIETFLEVASYLLVLLGVLMLIWTGFQFIMARGNSERTKELKDQLLFIVIGIAIVIGARIIVSVVINTLQATGTLDPGVTSSIQNAISGH